ncbi:MAG: 16S rRNA (adenine(1518)-N(6)/adenine(1519)-N(6))-dimethyltransferase RsmA [Alphaproteobacteria bacterium]|nr:16S rRNA (adenine(1518)-N(6)/adenine(1519)-N(6))-dimethyltransferase RsmA [Alphaproteobacteria bacterium]
MSRVSHIETRIAAIKQLPPLRDIIVQHNLSAKKSLGQNFLLDLNITDKIIREVINHNRKDFSDTTLFEIGPGPGGLTRSILKSDAKKLIALEYDSRAIEALQSLKEAAQGTLEIIQADALKINLMDLSVAPRAIVANLPYNIATPLLINWLKLIRDDENAFQSMSLMFQKEVADRILAKPETKAYGRLSIISQWLCRVSNIYDLPPSAFTPPPKVNSAIVHFIPKELPEDAPDFSAVEKVTATAFNQRRKMIRSSLKEYMPVIEKLGIDPAKRAENLSVEDFLAIAKH